MLVELRIADLKAKNQRRIIAVYLSDSDSDYAPKDQRLFAVIH